MNISNEGISLIKKFEGCKLEAYYDAVNVLTIAYLVKLCLLIISR